MKVWLHDKVRTKNELEELKHSSPPDPQWITNRRGGVTGEVINHFSEGLFPGNPTVWLVKHEDGMAAMYKPEELEVLEHDTKWHGSRV
jgi:hypothetical protein